MMNRYTEVSMNEAPFSISVLDPQGQPLGEEAIADYDTFKFYKQLLTWSANHPEYTVHFRDRGGENQYFKLSDVVSTGKPYADKTQSFVVGGPIVEQVAQKNRHIDVKVRKVSPFDLPPEGD
jgi:hypothetical protein